MQIHDVPPHPLTDRKVIIQEKLQSQVRSHMNEHYTITSALVGMY